MKSCRLGKTQVEQLHLICKTIGSPSEATWQVCVYVCVCMHVCVWLGVGVCICVCVYVSMCVCVCLYIDVCVCVCGWVCVCVCVCLCVWSGGCGLRMESKREGGRENY